MSTITIAEKDYLVETLPDQSKGILQLMQLNNNQMSEHQTKLTLAQAANQELSRQLVESVKGVKALPKAKVDDPDKKPAANRRNRRASNATKKKQS